MTILSPKGKPEVCDNWVKKNITKCNKCRVVRIFTKEGDLYDMRVEIHRKFLPNSGETYREAEADFNVLKTNMCI